MFLIGLKDSVIIMINEMLFAFQCSIILAYVLFCVIVTFLAPCVVFYTD
jgi:hypothetical protein